MEILFWWHMSKKTVILLFIIVIAGVLRLWRLGEVPISPDWDEVSLGYNAYSIMHTGRDEFGKFLPFVLRSFDDYKPALYAYLAIPSIFIFGLDTFAVRLPSAIFGILTVIATYFLIKELFTKRLAFIVSFLLAISPWHIQFSRIAFESNIGLAFNIFAMLFFIKGLENARLLLISSFFMGINLYVYQSEKVFTPLLLIALIVIFRKPFFSLSKKYIVMAGILTLCISLPIVNYTFTNRESLARARDVSILANATPFLGENVDRLIRDKENNDYLGFVLDNRRTMYAKAFVNSYLSHFDLNWLFIKGDIARHHAPSMGLLYLLELPFLMVGLYSLLFGSFPKKIKLFIFSWFFIAPVPASITSDVPHAVRTLNFLPTFQIFTAIGILTAIESIRSLKIMYFKFLIVIFIFSFFIFNFLYYINQYFVQQNYFHARYWQYGYKEIVEYLTSIHNKYNKIIVSNTMPLDQSYMFFLFYSKYSPEKYLEKGGTKSGVLKETGNKFLNFEFRPFNYYDEKEHNILLVGSQMDFNEVFKTIKRIDYPNGEVAIRVVHKD